jgi:hypothetical protein
VGNYLRYEWTEEPTATFYLAKRRTYTVTVGAVAADYTRSSEWSEPVTFTTPDEFPVTTPSNIQVTSSQGVVTVSWDRSASDAGMMDYVAILHGGANGPNGSRILEAATTTTFAYPPGGDLWVTVQARDKAYRYSDTSDPVPVTVEPADNWEPPSTPANFRAAPTDSGILFQWDEPAHGIGPFAYEIYLDGSEVEEVRGDLELDSSYFFECNTRPGLTPAEFTITAKSYGFTSPPGESITLCF